MLFLPFIATPVFMTVYTRSLEWLRTHMMACPSRRWLHLQCPGCGSQRSLLALLSGNITESVQLYPALIPFLLVLLYTLLHLVFRFRQGALIIKYSQFAVAIIITVSYIYKAINHQIAA